MPSLTFRSSFLLLALALIFQTGCGMGAARPFVAGRDVLYADAFVPGQVGRWHTEADDLGKTTVEDEQLVIEVNAPNTLQFATLKEPVFDNFVLEVDARPLAGPGDGTYGVLFRMQGPNQFYRFEITANGLYLIERRNADGTWTRLIDDWTESAAINQGLNAVNRLRITAMGANFAFHINGELLRQLQDTSYSLGNIALDAGTYGQVGFRVAFDNVTVRKP
jgi:hypothetical protein